MKNIMMQMGPTKEDMDMAKEGLEGQIDSGESEEDHGFMSMVQDLVVNPKVVMGLVSAINKVLPLFGLPPLKATEFTPELVRVLAMAAQAITDAVANDDVPSELEYSMEDLHGGDQAILMIAGKLDRLSKTPGFKKFLKAKPSTPAEQPPAVDQVAAEKTSDAGPDIEKLFASRVS